MKCAIEQGKAKTLAKEKKQYREAKKKLKSHREKMDDVQPIFNEMRRLQEYKWFKDRGLEPVCISCQKPLGNDQWCAGHFYTRGEHTNIRFDTMNVYLQHNKRCNKERSGDIENYKIGLAVRFGEDEARRIMDYCERNAKAIKRFTDEELAELRKQWRAEIRRLKKELDLT